MATEFSNFLHLNQNFPVFIVISTSLDHFSVYLVPWTKQLRIGFYDTNFYMLHLNFIKIGKKAGKEISHMGTFQMSQRLQLDHKKGAKYVRPVRSSRQKFATLLQYYLSRVG